VKTNVFDVETLPRWRHERVVLVGDAAHAVSPTSGQGASLALEDAMDLAKQLRDDAGDHRRAFEAYERDRRARVARIVANGRRRGANKVSRIQAQLRNVAMWLGLNLFGERSQDWIYRYRVDWNTGAAR
jgi:2-polyprenyl-6-methoxyphenol hydroxylase-like FAD-dependent oxidoreductase